MWNLWMCKGQNGTYPCIPITMLEGLFGGPLWDQMSLPLLSPSWHQLAFSFHYSGRQLHVFSCSDTAGIGLA